MVDSETYKRKESAALTLLSMMDVPPMRVERRDWRWFLRNLAVRNKDHPLYKTTVEQLRWLARNEKKQRVDY